MRRTLTPLLAATALLVLAGCAQQTDTEPPAETSPATEAEPTPADEFTDEPTGGLATFDPNSDFPEAIVSAEHQDGFDYDGIHVKLTKAEKMPVEEVAVEDDHPDFADATPARFTFALENTTSEAFPLDEFTSTAYAGENLEALDVVPGILDGEPATEELPRQIAADNHVDYIVTYKIPDEHLDTTVLVEIAPMFEGTPIEYYIPARMLTDWAN